MGHFADQVAKEKKARGSGRAKAIAKAHKPPAKKKKKADE